MDVSIDMSFDTLCMVLRDRIRDNADSVSQDLIRAILIQCMAENHGSEVDNDGAEIIIRVKVPGTKECDRILGELGELNSGHPPQ